MNHLGYKNILLTGDPGCGKSTLLNELLWQAKEKVWFITQEIRNEEKQRTWFDVVTSLWNRYVLASKKEISDILFAGKYWIQTEWIKELMQTLTFKTGDILYLDEIAPMQLYTPWFQDFVEWFLSSPNPLLGTIKLDDTQHSFIRKIKQRKDVLVIDMLDTKTLYNREFLDKVMEKINKSQKYIQEKERNSEGKIYSRNWRLFKISR